MSRQLTCCDVCGAPSPEALKEAAAGAQPKMVCPGAAEQHVHSGRLQGETSTKDRWQTGVHSQCPCRMARTNGLNRQKSKKAKKSDFAHVLL